MDTLDFFMGISVLSSLLFINEHYISKGLRANLYAEKFARTVLETITEDMLEKIDELYFEINELKRKEKIKESKTPLRSVGTENRRLDL